VSLKSRKSVDSAGPDIHEETSVSWQRNDDKTYTKVTKVTHRDRKTGVVKPMKRLEPIVEGPYDVVGSAEESDTQFEYLGMNNETAYVYLKLQLSE
jgi:hypothetical protein